MSVNKVRSDELIERVFFEHFSNAINTTSHATRSSVAVKKRRDLQVAAERGEGEGKISEEKIEKQ